MVGFLLLDNSSQTKMILIFSVNLTGNSGSHRQFNSCCSTRHNNFGLPCSSSTWFNYTAAIACFILPFCSLQVCLTWHLTNSLLFYFTVSWYVQTCCVHLLFLFSWHDLKAHLIYISSYYQLCYAFFNFMSFLFCSYWFAIYVFDISD